MSNRQRRITAPQNLDDIARDRIIRWRRAARMTQKTLGDLCGRNSIWISRYENRYFNSDLDTLARMAGAFNQSIFAALDVKADPTEQEIIEYFRAIPRPPAREMARGLLRELAGAGAGKRGSGLPRGPGNGLKLASRRAGAGTPNV